MAESLREQAERLNNTQYKTLDNIKRHELEQNIVPENYSVTDYDNDPMVMSAYEQVVDYLAENQTAATALLDAGASTIGNSRASEMMRDDVIRIGAPAAKASILKDAPESVKASYRLLQSRFEAADIQGMGEGLQATKDYAADFIFNPEMAVSLGSLIASPFTGGGSFVATQATKQTAKAAARQKLKNAIAASSAAINNNPKKYIAAVSAAYGGGYDAAIQSLDVALDKKDEIDPMRVATTAAITAPLGVAGQVVLSKFGRALKNYFQKATDPEAKMDTEKVAVLFDEALEGEFIPKSAGELVDEAFRLPGPTVKVKNVGDNVQKLAVDFAEELGGGEKTANEILAHIRKLADSQETDAVVRGKFKQKLFEMAANLTGNFLGKHSGVLSPHLKVSGTARVLQEKLSYEFGIKTDLKTQKRVGQDLSEVQREVTGNFNEQFRSIVDELGLADKNLNMAAEINDALMISMRSSKPVMHSNLDEATNLAVTKAAAQVKSLYNDMGVKLKDIGVIKELKNNYVPRMWDRKAIEDNQSELIELFVSKAGMTKAGARKTVSDMLDIKNQVDTGGGGGYFFSAQRKINDIGDDADFQKFLNGDVMGSLHAYTFQAGKAIAKHRVLGVNNLEEFNKFWVNRIRTEITEAGGEFTAAHAKQIQSLYKHATGEGLERFGRTGQNIADAYGLVNRVAYLGLATVSSLTEPLLNFSRAGFINTIKGLGEALSISHKHITGDLQKKLMEDHNLTAAEALAEMRKFSININQNLSQIGNRLAGDDLVNEKMQYISNKFFRVNMLDQWTKFVQTVSFSAGKSLIRDNLEALAEYGGRKLDKRGLVLVDELKELNIDYKEGVAWLKAGAKTDATFYQQDYLRGAARYTDATILQPTAASGLKPKFHSDPRATILFQLLGYPVAFTNTVMKQTAKRLYKNKNRNAYKVIPAALAMTAVARFSNYARTGGDSESDEYTEWEKNKAALARWGGNGIVVDMGQRAATSAKYTKSVAPYLGMPFGPIGSDAISMAQQGLIPTAWKKVPFFSGSYGGEAILGKRKIKHLKERSKDLQEEVFGPLIPKFDQEVEPLGYAVGGIVRPLARKGNELVSDAFRKMTAKADEVDVPESEAGVADVLVTATDGIFDNKTIRAESNKIYNNLNELELEGVVDLSDFDHLDLVDALMINEIKKTNKPIAELEKIPSWKKAMESETPESVEFNWNKARKDMGISKDHERAIKTISELKDEIDPQGQLQYVIPEIVRGLRNKYQKYKVELTPAEKKKASLSKFDNSLTNTHAFMTKVIKTGMHDELLSEKGASDLAVKIITKLAAEGEIDFTKFKAPKLKGDTSDLSVLPEPQRKKARDKMVAKSVEKDPVFRTVTSFEEAEFNIAFAFPREIGVHVGTEGSATTVAIRGLPNNMAKRDLKEAIDTGTLTRTEAADRFADRNLLNPDLPEVNEFTKVADDMPLDEGYFGKMMDEGDDVDIKPITMQKGYIDVREPLFIDTDLATWEAEKILINGDWDEQFVKAIEAAGKTLTAAHQKKVDELTYRAFEFEKRNGGTVLDVQRDNLKKAQINLEFTKLLEDIGFDSIMYRNEVERGLRGEMQYSYILFKPNQFKVATSKAFNMDDMREGFREGGLVAQVFGKENMPKTLGKLATRLNLN